MTCGIALIAMLLVGIRPKALPEWIWTVGAACVLLVLGRETVPSALGAVAHQWNVLLFIAGLMGISLAAEDSGLFAWVTDAALERAGGSQRRLFIGLFALGAALTALLSNDATAIVLTPVVYRAVAGRGIDPLPYLYACTFVADTASFGLPFSNPANLLVIPQPGLTDWILHLGPPMLAALAINLAIFLIVFRTRLRGRYPFDRASPIGAPAGRTLVAMLAVALAYIAALIVDWPLGPVAFIGAALVLVSAGVNPARAARRIGWPTLLLLASLFVLLDSVERAGLVALAARTLHSAAASGPLTTILAAAFGSALSSNLFNNLPVAVISGSIAAHANQGWITYALVAGVDLGPNLAVTGSLATILWLAILRERGLNPSPLEYLRLGLCVVPPMLLTTSLWLWAVR